LNLVEKNLTHTSFQNVLPNNVGCAIIRVTIGEKEREYEYGKKPVQRAG
ncbi:hypothetical protein HMPREF3213_00675, partial [Heyndrickxia coagulans]